MDHQPTPTTAAPPPAPRARTERTRRPRATLLLVGALLAAAVASAPGASADGPTGGHTATPVLDIRPAELERGAPSRIARFDGSVLVDGARRIRTGLPGRWEVLGHDRTLDEYLAARAGTERTVVRRVRPDGGSRVLTRTTRPAGDVVASAEGDRVALSVGAARRTRVRVVDGRTGAALGSRTFAGHVSLLGTDHRVLLSRIDGARTGTSWWAPVRDRVRTVSPHAATSASLRADRLALLDGDPYDGGCQVVVTLSRPGTTWWRSCSERVEAFAPTGRMATVDLLADGLGPRVVSVRRPRGALQARFHVAGWFGTPAWEGPGSVVLPAVGSRHATHARCTVDADGPSCERAAPLTQAPRP